MAKYFGRTNAGSIFDPCWSRRGRSGLLFLLAANLLAALSLVTAQAEPRTVTLRADSWCPYNCGPNEPLRGYMIEIAERAMARLGFRVDYQLMPWDRTMSEVRDGRIDGAVGATELEADGLQLSGPLGMDADCFFVSSTNPWRYGGPETLPRVLLGAVSGYVHDEGPVDAYIAANDVPYGRVSTSKGEQASANNVRLLFLGRIDAILDSKAVVALEAFRLGRQPDLVSAGCLEALPLYIAFSPKQKRAGEMIGAINDEVADLRRSGELTTMLARYGLEDWVK